MATNERNQRIFAGSLKTRYPYLLLLSIKREAIGLVWYFPEALGPQNVLERSTAGQLFSQRDLG